MARSLHYITLTASIRVFGLTPIWTVDVMCRVYMLPSCLSGFVPAPCDPVSIVTCSEDEIIFHIGRLI